MGWSSGSELMRSVLDIVLPEINKRDRQIVVERLIEAFEDHDCDTVYELCDDYPEVRACLADLDDEEGA